MIVALLGPSADLERCEAARDALVAAGIEVAFDWPSQVRAMRDRGLTDADLSDEERRQIGTDCMGAVEECDLAWWLCSASVGAAFEAGYACHNYTRIVSSGEAHAIYRAGHHFATDLAALAWIVGMK